MICVDQAQNYIKLVVLEVILPLIYCNQVGMVLKEFL